MRAGDFSDAALDSEFEAIELTIGEVLRQLSLLQRDDDALQDGLVTPASLAESTVAAMAAQVNPRGDWVTATHYVAGDVVRNGGNIYLCFVEHSSGTFATDLAADYWEQIGTSAPLVTSVFGRTGAVVAASGDYTSTNVTNSSTAPGTSVTDALDGLQANKQAALGYTPVNKAGDTMSGALSLPASDPTSDDHSSRKAYVDTVGKRSMLSGTFLCPHKNLKIDPVDTTSSTVSATSLILENSSGVTMRIDSLSVTIDKDNTVGSPLGLDTGAWAAGIYSIWAIAKADGTKSVVYSAANPNAGGTPNLSAGGLSGYTFYGYLGSVYWSGTAFDFVYQRDKFVDCAVQNPLNAGTATSDTLTTLTKVPATARAIVGLLRATKTVGAGAVSAALRPVSGSDAGAIYKQSGNVGINDYHDTQYRMVFVTPQQYYYLVGGANQNLSQWIYGWEY
jgi:hypothetical protein